MQNGELAMKSSGAFSAGLSFFAVLSRVPVSETRYEVCVVSLASGSLSLTSSNRAYGVPHRNLWATMRQTHSSTSEMVELRDSVCIRTQARPSPPPWSTLYRPQSRTYPVRTLAGLRATYLMIIPLKSGLYKVLYSMMVARICTERSPLHIIA